MTLLPDEQELLSSNGNKIILTNQRLHMNNQSWGHSYQMTLFLEDISSVQLRYSSNMLLVTIAVLSLSYSLLSIFLSDDDTLMTKAVLLAGIVSLIAWWFSRRHIVSVQPHGGRPLRFLVNSVPELQIGNFIDKLQAAKAQRISKRYHL